MPVEAEGQTVEKNGTSLICVLLTDEQEKQVNTIACLSVLGTFDEIFADPSKLAIYDSIYDRSEQSWTDPETGEKHKYTPPDRFAEFALPAKDPQQDYNDMIAYRTKMLYQTDWTIQRHLEQKELGISTNLSDDDFKSTLIWRQSLRDMPESFKAGS